MKSTVAANLARFSDLSDGELFIGTFGKRSHVMFKVYDLENGDAVEYAVILSPTHELYDNKPGFVQPDALEATLVVQLKDFELHASLDPEKMSVESGFDHDVGAIFILEQGIHLCARAPGSVSQSVLIDINTGQIVEHSEPLPNAKITSWQIRRRVGNEVETIVEYPNQEKAPLNWRGPAPGRS